MIEHYVLIRSVEEYVAIYRGVNDIKYASALIDVDGMLYILVQRGGRMATLNVRTIHSHLAERFNECERRKVVCFKRYMEVKGG